MSQEIILTIIEIVIGIVVEGIILGLIFAYISDLSQDKQQQNLQNEMNRLETQNKFEFEQLLKNIEQTKTEIISQIKESNYENGGKS